MATRNVSLSLDPYSYDCLQAMADDQDRSLSYIACVAIQKYVEGNENPGSGLDYDVLKELKKKHRIDEGRGRK
jgi:predicted transcriptional regulator